MDHDFAVRAAEFGVPPEKTIMPAAGGDMGIAGEDHFQIITGKLRGQAEAIRVAVAAIAKNDAALRGLGMPLDHSRLRAKALHHQSWNIAGFDADAGNCGRHAVGIKVHYLKSIVPGAPQNPVAQPASHAL